MIEICISFFIKYSKFTDNIGSGNFTDTFCQNTNKFKKSVCVCVLGGGGRGGVLHPHTHSRFAPPCLDITTSKAQIISAFVTSCYWCRRLLLFALKMMLHLNLPLESLLNKVEALDEGSGHLKNKIGVSFGSLSLCSVPSASEKRAVI